MKVTLQEDGPTAILSLALAEYPPRPPARWKRAGFNAVILQLRLFALEHFQQRGWQINNMVNIEIKKNGNSIEFHAHGQTVTLLIRCGFIDVAALTGYSRMDPPSA